MRVKVKRRYLVRYAVELEKSADGVLWRLTDPLDENALLASGSAGDYPTHRAALIKEIETAIATDLDACLPESLYDTIDEDGWDELDT